MPNSLTRASLGESRGLPSHRQRGFHELATLCWERTGHWDVGHSLVIAALVIGHLLQERLRYGQRRGESDDIGMLAFRQQDQSIPKEALDQLESQSRCRRTI